MPGAKPATRLGRHGRRGRPDARRPRRAAPAAGGSAPPRSPRPRLADGRARRRRAEPRRLPRSTRASAGRPTCRKTDDADARWACLWASRADLASALDLTPAPARVRRRRASRAGSSAPPALTRRTRPLLVFGHPPGGLPCPTPSSRSSKRRRAPTRTGRRWPASAAGPGRRPPGASTATRCARRPGRSWPRASSRARGVVILAFNRPEWYVANLATIAVGARPAGIYTNTHARAVPLHHRARGGGGGRRREPRRRSSGSRAPGGGPPGSRRSC